MFKWSLASVCLVLGGVVGLVANPLQSSKPAAPVLAPSETQSYRGIVQRVLPGVVSIETKPAVVKAKQASPKRKSLPDDMQVPEQFRKYLDQFESEMPQPGPGRGFGSGFIVDPSGTILTNHHVVQGADHVIVQLQDGRKFISKDIKSDPTTDLAIVRVDAKSPLPALELGNSDDMEIGDRVLAVGAPFGLTGSVTSGIISAKSRSLRTNKNGDYLQTDAAINPGNSGGPLVNISGQVVGITTAIKSSSGGSQGVGLAITSKLAKNVMDQLSKHGVVARGYLGVQIKDLEPEIAVRLGVENHTGVLVAKVMEGTPAAKAGIQAGDVITAVAGKTVHDGTELQSLVSSLTLGKETQISVVREGKVRSITVTIAEQPRDMTISNRPQPATSSDEPRVVPFDRMGFELQDLNPALAKKLGYQAETSGALVTRVERDSLADEAGLERGTLIVKVDNTPVRSAETAQTVLNKASLKTGILLELMTPQGRVDFVLLRSEDDE